MRQRLLAGLLLGLAATRADAALLGRLPLTPGGIDYRAYYDDVLGITWVADGNLAATNAFGVAGIGTGTSVAGAMNWEQARQFVAALNAAGYLGATNWRLPATTDTGAPGCDFAWSGTDCGYNMDPATGELVSLHYATLRNAGGYDAGGIHQDCDTGLPAPPACLTYFGPFANFLPNHYWTGTAFTQDPAMAWEFDARNGVQNLQAKTRASYVWAVRDGDIDTGTDHDQDGVADAADDCVFTANADQFDGDADGFGNLCDADLNNSGLVTTTDLNILHGRLNTADAAADLNHSGLVTVTDYNLARARLNRPPGPSGRTLDVIAPTFTIGAPPAEGGWTSANSASFAIVASEPATICWSLDGGMPSCSARGAMSVTAAITGLAAGGHALAVSVTDYAGNAATGVRDWTVAW